jgi:hypothetical protein
MPSENEHGRYFPHGGWWAWLTSQQLGILCGLSTVALLAIGSIVLTVTRDGASAAVAMDDVRVFFAQPSPVHLWFYALCGVLALYALNTLLATWQSVSRKWQFGIRAPQMYAPAIIHVAFLVALLAHLAGGLASDERGQVLVGPSWTALGDGREASVTDLDFRQNADGSLRQAAATLELRAPDRAQERAVVSYNGPLSAGFGTDLFLLTRPTALPAARLVRGDAQCVVGQEESCMLGPVQVALLHLETTSGTHGAMARVEVRRDGAPAQAVWLFEGRPQTLDDGSELRLAAVDRRPAVLLRHRRAPGNPVALVASLLLAGGLLLMWRRFLPAPSRP